MAQGMSSPREVFRLSVPQLGLMLCHLAVSMTDVWVAGQIDRNVLASLGLVSQAFALLMLVVSIVGSGCMATVSQALGGGRTRRALRYGGLIVGISFLTGCLVAALALAALPAALGLGLVPGNVAPVLLVFGTAYAAQLPFYYSMIMLNSVFRAHKLVWLPFATLVLVALINFVGSAGFGLGRWGLPAWGYPAVAWATFFSALAGFVCNVAIGTRRGILCRAAFATWRWNRVAAPRIWRIGAPAALGNLAAQTGGMALLACVTGLPRDAVAAVAGMTLGMRIMGFVLFPLGALGMTITILSGHLLGGGRQDAASGLGARYAIGTACCMTAVALAVGALREPVVLLFTRDAAAGAQAANFLFFSCLALPAQAAVQVLSAALAGAGATRFTCRIGCVSTWGVSVPTAGLLAYGLARGASGVYAGMTLGNVCAALWTIHVFRGKQWLGSAPMKTPSAKS